MSLGVPVRDRSATVLTSLSSLCLLVLTFSCAKSPEMVPPEGGEGTGGATAVSTGGSTVPAGTGGTSVSTGSGGGTVMKDPSNYPQTVSANHLFPQGHTWSRCAFPAYSTDTVSTAYKSWKAKFFQSNRVVRPEYANDTVSEGIAYGMLIGVYMNDRPMFDALWTFAQSKRDGNGLMNWHIDANGNTVNPGGGATDADEDMAWALLMASAQWGGSYMSAATTLIDAIWAHEVDAGGGFVLKPGGNFGGANLTNPSYFAPSYYRVFANVTPSHNWMAVVESSYAILAKAAGTRGLVPNWTNGQGVGINGPGNDTQVDPHFGYDACRTPWRIALDYCENGEPRAKTYMDLIVNFYAGAGSIRDGYTVAGANPPGTLGDYAAGMAFFGPAAVAALGGGHEAFLKTAYGAIVNGTTVPAIMGINGVFTYYHASWGVLALLTTSGNFWNLLSP